MQPMLTRRRWRISHLLIGLLVLAAGGFWLYQTIRRGDYSIDPGNATAIVRSRPADGERNVPVESVITATVTPGRAVDKDTLTPDAVKLYRLADRQTVAGITTTNTQGDEITFKPFANLEPSTRYRFEIQGAKDDNEDDFLPYAISFTTAATN
jgi:hypothetical protein